VHWLTAVSTLPRRFCAPSARPDLVVISGDIADSALPEEYAHATKLLGALQVPFVAIPGNHDRRPLIRETFPDPAYGTADCALNTLRRIDGLDILLINSTVAGAPHGELDAPTLSWLDETLGASTTRPALLFLHHPPFDTGIAYTDAVRLRNSDALAAVLGRHPLRTAGRGRTCSSFGPQTVFAGISASICPGASRRLPSHSNHAGRRFSESSLQPSICTHGFPDRDSEAWLLTSCR
jgi:3',5'-cyclic-AMP phosphodiesterase